MLCWEGWRGSARSLASRECKCDCVGRRSARSLGFRSRVEGLTKLLDNERYRGGRDCRPWFVSKGYEGKALKEGYARIKSR